MPLRFTEAIGKECLRSFGCLQRFRFRRIQRSHEHVKISTLSIGRLIGGPPLSLDIATSRLPAFARAGREAWTLTDGNAGSGHIALGGGNRSKGLAVSSAWKNRPGSQVLRPRNIRVLRVYEGFDQAGSFNLPTSGGLRLAVSGGRCGHRPSAPTRPTPRRRRSYDGVRRMTKGQRAIGRPIAGLPCGAERQQPYSCSRDDA
jgi:hypothetical protein